MLTLISKLFNSLFDFFENFVTNTRLRIFKIRYPGIARDFRMGLASILYGDGDFEIGRGTYIGRYCHFQAHEGAKIVIGRNCSISHSVRIYTYNNVADDIIGREEVIRKKKGDVVIGDNCWIGANVFITEGVTIGDHCVIGANSVVTRNVASNTLAAGAPARTIKHKEKQEGLAQ